MALTLGELVGYLRLDDKGFDKKANKAVRTMREMAREADDSSSNFGKFVGGIDRAGSAAARNAVNFANTTSNIGTLLQVLSATGQIASSSAGALGVLPAAGAAIGIAYAAAAVGMSGFGEAMKNLQDPEKFAEAIKTLSPAAREAAESVRAVAPAWEAMQNKVQDRLFERTGAQIAVLARVYLPLLERGLGGVAHNFNTAARETGSFLAKGQQARLVAGIFDDTTETTKNLAGGLRPIVSILLDIVAVGADFLPGLTSGFDSAAESAAAFIRNARETGQLRQWISEGLSTLGDLWTLFKNIAGIVGTIFGAFQTEGGSALDTLIKLTGQVKDFLRSVQGQEALRALASAFHAVSDVATDVLITALKVLAQIVVELAPGVATLAHIYGDMLVGALTTLAPLLVAVAGFLADNAAWLGPLALGLFLAVKAFQALAVVMRIISVLASVNPWVLLIAATIALAVLIATHWEQIRAVIAAVWQWLQETAGAVWGWIKQTIIDNIVEAAEWVGQQVQRVLDFFAWLGRLPGQALEWFGGILRAARDRLGELVRWVAGIPGDLLRALGNLGSLLYQGGRDLIIGLGRGIADMGRWLWDKLTGLVRNAWNGVLDFLGIGSPSKVAMAVGRNVGQSLATGLGGQVNAVSAAAAMLAEAATPHVDPLGDQLANVPAPRLPAEVGGLPVAGGDGAELAPVQIKVTNHYPQAEPTSVTTNRSLQYAAAVGLGV